MTTSYFQIYSSQKEDFAHENKLKFIQTGKFVVVVKDPWIRISEESLFIDSSSDIRFEFNSNSLSSLNHTLEIFVDVV